MDKATKTKIILFASLGIFVLVVLAVTLALTGKGDNREEDGSVNTSLRAQQQSDFTLDDMMNTDGRPEYENFTDEVYRDCLLYTSPSPRDGLLSRMPSSA